MTVPKASTLRFGIALSGGGDEREKLTSFCEALGEDLDLDVGGLALWHYDRLIEAMDVGDVDVAWLPPVIALLAATSGRVVPVAIPVRRGVTKYSTAIFTREGGEVASLADLVGRTAAWVDRRSTSGYLLARAHLRASGVDLGRAFRSERFLGSHELVVRAVMEGTADVGATFVYVDPRPGDGLPVPVRAGWGKESARVLAVAGPIPADVMAASARIEAPLVERFRRALLSPSRELERAAFELLRADRFLPATTEHLAPLTALLPALDGETKLAPRIWPKKA